MSYFSRESRRSVVELSVQNHTHPEPVAQIDEDGVGVGILSAEQILSVGHCTRIVLYADRELKLHLKEVLDGELVIEEVRERESLFGVDPSRKTDPGSENLDPWYAGACNLFFYQGADSVE